MAFYLIYKEKSIAMAQLTANQLYNQLRKEIIDAKVSGKIVFTLLGLDVKVKSKDTVGNLIQEWLKEYLRTNDIYFAEKENTQSFPDFLLEEGNDKAELLEVKSFDYDRGPGF